MPLSNGSIQKAILLGTPRWAKLLGYIKFTVRFSRFNHERKTTEQQPCMTPLFSTTFLYAWYLRLFINRDGNSLNFALPFQLHSLTLHLSLLEALSWRQECQQWTHTQSSSSTTFLKSSFVHTWPLKLEWLRTVMDMVFAAMHTAVTILQWLTSFGCSMVSFRFFRMILVINACQFKMNSFRFCVAFLVDESWISQFQRFGTFGTPSSLFLERSGANFPFCMYTIISPSSSSTGSMPTHNTMEMCSLQSAWMDSSILSCTLTTSFACTPRTLRQAKTCQFGGNRPWPSCNWFNSWPWWLKQFIWWQTVINVLEIVLGTLLHTLCTFWLCSSFLRNSLLLHTWSQRRRKRLLRWMTWVMERKNEIKLFFLLQNLEEWMIHDWK